MQNIFIVNAENNIDQEVSIKGWVYNMRSSGKISFLQIRDGSGFIQAIAYKPDLSEELIEKIESITLESSVELIGTISKHPKKEEYELQLKDLKIIHLNNDEYPIGKKEHGPDFLLSHRHLWLRSTKQWAIQRIRNQIILSTFAYFNENNFIKIDTPIFTPAACEGTTTLFEVDYFGNPVYLTQSGQLYLEAAIASHGRVFDFGPVFRAEKSKTRRHLIEFWMMDAEMAFTDYEQNMDIQEALIKRIMSDCLEKCSNELEILERDIEPLKKVVEKPFIRMKHSEVVKELHEMGSDIGDNDDLGADDETMFTKKYDVPIFVSHYPAEVKAFYMKRDESDKFALCSDLLAPEGYGEIIGGSEREADYDMLIKRIEEHNLPMDAFEWYLDTRRYGSVPHSGFGYGLERIVAWISGISHLRETIPFPRLLNRWEP